MSIEGFQSGQPVPKEVIPDDLRERIGPDAPEKGRSLIARAALPMPPEQLGVALAVLARDPSEEVAESAAASLRDLPRSSLEELVGRTDLHGAVLDVFAHVLSDEPDLLGALIRNEATEDDTVRWMAAELRGDVLELISNNQVRVTRAPGIIEALIQNPATPTAVLARVIETAVRNEADTSGIPGFRELARAYLGDLGGGETAEEQEDTTDQGSEPHEGVPQEAFEAAQQAVDASEAAQQAGAAEHGESEERRDEEEQQARTKKQPIWKLIEDMSLPQRVRLALTGNAPARKILIRDGRAIVARSVLRNPKLTDKEIAAFAKDRSLDGEIIRQIATSRTWTRHYTVKQALVQNPKTPVQTAVTFLPTLRRNDLRHISRARDVPAYVARQARATLRRRGA